MSTELQLFIAKFKESCHFDSQRSSLSKAIAVQDDFSNDHSVGDYHCDLAEESFEVVWERCATNEEGVHGDEWSTESLELENSVVQDDELV